MITNRKHDEDPSASFNVSDDQISTSQRDCVPAVDLIDDNYAIIDDESIADNSIMDALAKAALKEDEAGKTIDLK